MQLKYDISLMELARIELASATCKAAVLPLNESPRTKLTYMPFYNQGLLACKNRLSALLMGAARPISAAAEIWRHSSITLRITNKPTQALQNLSRGGLGRA